MKMKFSFEIDLKQVLFCVLLLVMWIEAGAKTVEFLYEPTWFNGLMGGWFWFWAIWGVFEILKGK